MLRTEIGPGLGERELDAVEARFGFTVSADHRVFLAAGLPHGSRRRPDWRHGDPEDLDSRLSGPVGGVLFDVEHTNFGHPAWSPRPTGTSDALLIARSEAGGRRADPAACGGRPGRRAAGSPPGNGLVR
ncbi:hypothetical protein [Streptomyces sp. NPDC093093]|uniref:hypothetical protein n=1 Tax=Streptomyces sp. NPDC093093 TaxID=3366025 RepID=UPI003817C4E9